LMFGTRTHPETREVIRMTAVIGGLRRRAARQALSTAPPPVLPLPMVH